MQASQLLKKFKKLVALLEEEVGAGDYEVAALGEDCLYLIDDVSIARNADGTPILAIAIDESVTGDIGDPYEPLD